MQRAGAVLSRATFTAVSSNGCPHIAGLPHSAIYSALKAPYSSSGHDAGTPESDTSESKESQRGFSASTAAHTQPGNQTEAQFAHLCSPDLPSPYGSNTKYWSTLNIEPVPTAPKNAPVRPENSETEDQHVVLECLEEVAHGGPAGILRTDLCKALNISPVNIHYYVKGLLASRQLAVTGVRFKNAAGHIVNNSAVIHLRKFAPDCSFAAQQASQQRRDGGYLLPSEDEELLLGAVTSKLAALPGKVAPITEIKAYFEFKGPNGHRLWRRLCDRLKKCGCVREFDGIIQDKSGAAVELPMMQVLKPFTTDNSTNVYFTWPETQPMHLLPRHMSPTRAVLDAMVARGGLSSEELSNTFGLVPKASYKLMGRMQTDYKVEAAKETGTGNKKLRVYRYKVPKVADACIWQYLPWQSRPHITAPAAADPADAAGTAAAAATDADAATAAAAGTATAASASAAAAAAGGAGSSSAGAAAEATAAAGAATSRSGGGVTGAEGGMVNDCASERVKHGLKAIITAAAAASNKTQPTAAANIASTSNPQGGPSSNLLPNSLQGGSATPAATPPAGGDGQNTPTAPKTGATSNADSIDDQNTPEATGQAQKKTGETTPHTTKNTTGGKANTPADPAEFNYAKIRAIRENVILKHVADIGFVLVGEPRWLWFCHARKAGLPLAFMDADHKTVKRILAAMEARGVLKPPVTIDVPVAKSRLSLCRPRPVQVYCGPDCKLASNTQDLEEAVKARHAVLDANVRSRDYVNRAKILGVPETEENEEEGAGGGQEADGDAPQTSASMHVGMHMIGALVPSFRDQVERALEQARKGEDVDMEVEEEAEDSRPSKDKPAAKSAKTKKTKAGTQAPTCRPSTYDKAASKQKKAKPAQGGKEGEAKDGGGGTAAAALPKTAAAHSAAASAAADSTSEAGQPTPLGGSLGGQSEPITVAKAPAKPRYPTVPTANKPAKGTKRKAADKLAPSKPVKLAHLRAMPAGNKFADSVIQIRNSCAVFVKAWRARSLHLFLMDLCGLHSGTPLDVLTRAHVRSMPQVFHRESTAAGSLQYMPDAHAYDAVRATVPFDGSRVKLSPLLVALCMPVRNVLLVYGSTVAHSAARMEALEKDNRPLVDLTDKEIADIFDGVVLARVFETLNTLAALRLLTIDDPHPTQPPLNPPSTRPSTSDSQQDAATGIADHHQQQLQKKSHEGQHLVSSVLSRIRASRPTRASLVFTVARSATIHSPVTAQDTFRNTLMHMHSQSARSVVGAQPPLHPGNATPLQGAAPPTPTPTPPGAPVATTPLATRPCNPMHAAHALGAVGAAAHTVQTQPPKGEAHSTQGVTNTTRTTQAGTTSQGDGSKFVSITGSPSKVPMVAESARNNQLLPEESVHAFSSVLRRPGDMHYELEYDVGTWGGWLGFWDHIAAIRSDKMLSLQYSGHIPLSAAKEMMAHASHFGHKRLRCILHTFPGVHSEVRSDDVTRGVSSQRTPTDEVMTEPENAKSGSSDVSRGNALRNGGDEEQNVQREDAARALKRRFAASLGLSLAEFTLVATGVSGPAAAQKATRLGGLGGNNMSAGAAQAAKAEARRVAKAASDAAKMQKAAARKAAAEERRKKALASKASAAVNLLGSSRASQKGKLADDEFDLDLDGSFGPACKRRNTESGAQDIEGSMLAGSAAQPGEGVKVKRRRRQRRVARKVLQETRDGTFTSLDIYDSDDSQQGIAGVLQWRKIRKAERRIGEETTLMPQGQRSAARAARSAAGCMLLHAAGLIPPGAEAGDAGGADDPPLADADEDSSAEDGDPADGEGMDVVTRRRHRPIRWRADEEKALLRAFIQKTITTGPAHELMLVPWTAFAGVHTHSTSACIRRINFYRTIGNLTMPPAQEKQDQEHPDGRRRRPTPSELQAGNMFHQLTVKATRVHRLRAQQRSVRLLDHIKQASEHAAKAPQGSAAPDFASTSADAAAMDDNVVTSLCSIVHADIHDILPPRIIAAVVAPEDLSKVPEDSLFLPSSHDEQLLHMELVEGLAQFFDMIPVSRPAAVTERQLTDDVQLLCRPQGRRAAAPERRLRAHVRIASAASAPGQVASAAAADAVGWRSSAAAAALLSTIACMGAAPSALPAAAAAAAAAAVAPTPAAAASAAPAAERHVHEQGRPGSPQREALGAASDPHRGAHKQRSMLVESSTSTQAAALLQQHPQARVAAAVQALCRARVLRAERSASLQLVLTQQVAASRDATLQACAQPCEVLASTRRLRGERTEHIDHLLNHLSAVVPPKERVGGGLVSIVVTGVTSGHLDLAVEFTRSPRLTDSSLRDLDQFTPKCAISIQILSSNFPTLPCSSLHSGHFLTKRLVLSISSSSAAKTAAIGTRNPPEEAKTQHDSAELLMPGESASSHRTALILGVDTWNVEDFPAVAALATPSAGAAAGSSHKSSVPENPASGSSAQPAVAPAEGTLGCASSACMSALNSPESRTEIRQLLNSTATAMHGSLRSHLVATGALEREFIPVEAAVSDDALNACVQCMTAIDSALVSAGARGMRLADLLRQVATGAPLGQKNYNLGKNGTTCDAASKIAEAAELVGQVLVLQNPKIAAAGALAFDNHLWPPTRGDLGGQAGSQGGVSSKWARGATPGSSTRGEAGPSGGAALAAASAPSECQGISADTRSKEVGGALSDSLRGSKHTLAFAGMHLALHMMHERGLISLQPHLGASLSAVSTSVDLTDPDAHVVRKLASGRELVSLPPDSSKTQTREQTAAVATGTGLRNSQGPFHEASNPPAASQPQSQTGAAACMRGGHCRVAVPWVLPSGDVSMHIVQDLIGQIHTLLSTQPGMPEDLLAEKMQHALGRAHLRMFMRRMCENGHARQVSIPTHSTCALVDTATTHSDGMLAPTADGLIPSIFGGCEGPAAPKNVHGVSLRGTVGWSLTSGDSTGTSEEPSGELRKPSRKEMPLVLPLEHCYYADIASSVAGWQRAEAGTWA